MRSAGLWFRALAAVGLIPLGLAIYFALSQQWIPAVLAFLAYILLSLPLIPLAKAMTPDEVKEWTDKPKVK